MPSRSFPGEHNGCWCTDEDVCYKRSQTQSEDRDPVREIELVMLVFEVKRFAPPKEVKIALVRSHQERRSFEIFNGSLAKD